jgi:hypothetical protein
MTMGSGSLSSLLLQLRAIPREKRITKVLKRDLLVFIAIIIDGLRVKQNYLKCLTINRVIKIIEKKEPLNAALLFCICFSAIE